MERHWVETVDDELDTLGLLVAETPHILGMDIQSGRQHVELVLAADTPPRVVAQVDVALKQATGPRLTAETRWSSHTLADLQAGHEYVLDGDWARAEPIEGPMSVSYSPALDRIEVHLPPTAASSAARLTAARPGLVHVVLDDGMIRRR